MPSRVAYLPPVFESLAKALLIIHLVSRTGKADGCAQILMDIHANQWLFNLTSLSRESDFEVSEGDSKLSFRVCQPPNTACNQTDSHSMTPTAVACSGLLGMQCQGLGWGALGATGSHWSLIDHGNAHAGVRVMHYGFHSTNLSGVHATDEWGAPRPSTFTADFVCDHMMAQPTAHAVQEPGQLLRWTPSDHGVVITSVAACPLAAIGPDNANAAHPTSDTATAVTSHQNANREERGRTNPVFMFLATISAIALLILLLLGFSHVNTKQSGYHRANMIPWPAASQSARWRRAAI